MIVVHKDGLVFLKVTDDGILVGMEPDEDATPEELAESPRVFVTMEEWDIIVDTLARDPHHVALHLDLDDDVEDDEDDEEQDENEEKADPVAWLRSQMPAKSPGD